MPGERVGCRARAQLQRCHRREVRAARRERVRRERLRGTLRADVQPVAVADGHAGADTHAGADDHADRIGRADDDTVSDIVGADSRANGIGRADDDSRANGIGRADAALVRLVATS